MPNVMFFKLRQPPVIPSAPNPAELIKQAPTTAMPATTWIGAEPSSLPSLSQRIKDALTQSKTPRGSLDFTC